MRCGRRALAIDVGVSPGGTGSHRPVLGSDAGPFTGPDGFAWTPHRCEPAGVVASQAPGWWLHIDLDVLDRNDFSACGAPGEVSLPGGLSWSELAAMTSSAIGVGGVCGWSLGVYNPDLDPELQAAGQIASFVAEITSNWM